MSFGLETMQDTQVENFELEVVVAAILAAGTMKEADSTRNVLVRYRNVLREIQRTGGIFATDEALTEKDVLNFSPAALEFLDGLDAKRK